MATRELQKKRKRRFRFAAGYVIDQEGTKVVERLIKNGSFSRFGIREEWVPSMNLENLNRSDAEDILEQRVWRFYNYHLIDEALVVPTKIFDTHVLFSAEVAIGNAKQALQDLEFKVEENGRLDPETRSSIERVDSNNFLNEYEFQLERYINSNYGTRKALVQRVKNVPDLNVNSSPTTL